MVATDRSGGSCGGCSYGGDNDGMGSRGVVTVVIAIVVVAAECSGGGDGDGSKSATATDNVKK